MVYHGLSQEIWHICFSISLRLYKKVVNLVTWFLYPLVVKQRNGAFSPCQNDDFAIYKASCSLGVSTDFPIIFAPMFLMIWGFPSFSNSFPCFFPLKKTRFGMGLLLGITRTSCAACAACAAGQLWGPGDGSRTRLPVEGSR